jgi:hypothetical protein
MLLVSPEPLIVYVDGDPGVPAGVVDNDSDVGLTVSVGVGVGVGVGVTVPLTATSCVVAPVLELVTEPAMEPTDALALIRTSIVVEETEPEVSVMSRVVL